MRLLKLNPFFPGIVYPFQIKRCAKKNSSIRIKKSFQIIQVLSVFPLFLVSGGYLALIVSALFVRSIQFTILLRSLVPEMRCDFMKETAPELVMLSVSSCWSCALTHYAQYILPWLCGTVRKARAFYGKFFALGAALDLNLVFPFK